MAQYLSDQIMQLYIQMMVRYTGGAGGIINNDGLGSNTAQQSLEIVMSGTADKM